MKHGLTGWEQSYWAEVNQVTVRYHSQPGDDKLGLPGLLRVLADRIEDEEKAKAARYSTKPLADTAEDGG